MPAQSPTLSPTLSAMVAALRGSSSGMPASTLPTMSPPTSAPLVKMPPPRRAKMEISEAPKPSATRQSTTSRLVGSSAERPGQDGEVAGDAEQGEARHQHAGDGAGAEGQRQALGQALATPPGRCARWRAPRSACRRSRPRRRAPRRSGSRAPRSGPIRKTDGDQDDHADDGDGRCTGGADRPGRLPGSPRRSPACARCLRSPSSAFPFAARRRGSRPRRPEGPTRDWNRSSKQPL